MTARFVPNEAGLAELERQAGDGAAAVAEAIADRARALAPVRTGEYRDSIHVEVDAGGTARVVADAPHAAVVEFGTADTPAFAPLLRATDATAPDAAAIVGRAIR